MDAAIQERHRQRVAALTAPPRVGQVVAWDAHYAADAVLVTPDGQLLRGVADIASFLGDETIRPVELELLQADRVGATGYAVATYKTAEKPPRSGTAFTLYTTGPAAALLISVDIYGGAPPAEGARRVEGVPQLDRPLRQAHGRRPQVRLHADHRAPGR